MSIPNLPKIDPEMTRERAFDMILASIAMEEIALSHIMDAEGEKLRYAIAVFEKNLNPGSADWDKILSVNQSISDLLEIVAQNQMLLKSKMDKVLRALPPRPPIPPVPPDPPGPRPQPRPPSPVYPCLCTCRPVLKCVNNVRYCAPFNHLTPRPHI